MKSPESGCRSQRSRLCHGRAARGNVRRRNLDGGGASGVAPADTAPERRGPHLSGRAVRARDRALPGQESRRSSSKHRRPCLRSLPPQEVEGPDHERRVHPAGQRRRRSGQWQFTASGFDFRNRADAGPWRQQPVSGQTPGRGAPTGGVPGTSQQGQAAGITGVRSKSTATSIKVYQNQQQYSLWPFDAAIIRAANGTLAAAQQPGGNQPGGRPGGPGTQGTQPGRGGQQIGPGGMPGRGGGDSRPAGPGGAGPGRAGGSF